MKVLVTGGAGFIGSHFVRHLLAAGDRGGRARQADLRGQPGEPRRRGRRTWRSETSPIAEAVARGGAGCDAVVNFAAETHVDRSILGAREFVQTNVARSRRRCSSGCARPGCGSCRSRRTRCTATSRAASAHARRIRCTRPARTAASKAAGDLLVLAYVRTYGVNASVTRGANTYGARQHPEKLIPLFVTNALDGLPLPVYGDGRQRREWLHAADHCAAIELVLREGAPGEVYNVGGEEFENIEVDAPYRRADRRRSGSDHARGRPSRPRPALRARRRASCESWAGGRRTRSARRGCPRRWRGIARTARGAKPSGRVSTARTTSSSTAGRLSSEAQGFGRDAENAL